MVEVERERREGLETELERQVGADYWGLRLLANKCVFIRQGMESF